ncbi:hypothetical protein BDF22DRAFT_739342 [Syncephalis plumigaleata]|nr:hypothetical protein BDF22DRAFT_739342 [Syncephalis plumigaleata]
MEAIALHACQADDPLHELSFAKDDVLLNVRSSPTDDGWYEATLERTGERGLVPSSTSSPPRHKKATVVPESHPVIATDTAATAVNLLESGVDTEHLPTSAFGVVLRPTASKPSISSPSSTTSSTSTSTSTSERHTKDTAQRTTHSSLSSSQVAKRPPPPRPKPTVPIPELSHQTSNHSLESSITLVDTTLPNLPPRPSMSSLSSQPAPASAPPPIPPKPTNASNNTLNTSLPYIDGIPSKTIQRYMKAFKQWDRNHDDYLEGFEVRAFWRQSRLDRDELRKIWQLHSDYDIRQLADRDSDGRLNQREFCIGTWLIDERLRGKSTPETLPVHMIFE